MKRFNIFGMEVEAPWAATCHATTEGVHAEFFLGHDGKAGSVGVELTDAAARNLLVNLTASLAQREAK